MSLSKFQTYPLQFNPILKERIWGGNKLHTILGKSNQGDNIGESWEISSVEDNVSIVNQGFYKGELLTDLVNNFPVEMLGTTVFNKYGNKFPLLFKFLDCKLDLSIQVHPSDNLAQKRHNAFGKTEMWFIMEAEKNARILVGFQEQTSQNQYLEKLKNKTIDTFLEQISVQSEDAFFIATGTVHAIGAGILLAEIQQTSDITYRIYDFDRLDNLGKKRELHTELALDAINYSKIETRKHFEKSTNTENNIVNCPFFITNFISLDGELILNKNGTTFIVLMITDGELNLFFNNEKIYLKKGNSVLIPASLTNCKLVGKASLLQVFMN